MLGANPGNVTLGTGENMTTQLTPNEVGHGAGRMAALACVLWLVFICGCTGAPPEQNNDNQDSNDNTVNDNGGVQLDGFPFDIELGRSGSLALPTENCTAEVVSTVTGSGSFQSAVITSETVAQPYIETQVSAPKGTDGGVIISGCSLQGRFAVIPGNSGATSATADFEATIRVDVDQNGEAAGGYQYSVSLSMFQVSATNPDTSIGTDLGSADRSYCMLPLTCSEPFPAGDNFSGMERIGLSLGNIELQANSEYIAFIVVAGSMVSSEGSPDLLGGSFTARATVESISLTFINDDQDDP